MWCSRSIKEGKSSWVVRDNMLSHSKVLHSIFWRVSLVKGRPSRFKYVPRHERWAICRRALLGANRSDPARGECFLVWLLTVFGYWVSQTFSHSVQTPLLVFPLRGIQHRAPRYKGGFSQLPVQPFSHTFQEGFMGAFSSCLVLGRNLFMFSRPKAI